jgi:hypothetical protein
MTEVAWCVFVAVARINCFYFQVMRLLLIILVSQASTAFYLSGNIRLIVEFSLLTSTTAKT